MGPISLQTEACFDSAKESPRHERLPSRTGTYLWIHHHRQNSWKRDESEKPAACERGVLLTRKPESPNDNKEAVPDKCRGENPKKIDHRNEAEIGRSNPPPTRASSMSLLCSAGGSSRWTRRRCTSPRRLRLTVLLLAAVFGRLLQELRAAEVVESSESEVPDQQPPTIPGPRVAIIGGALTGSLTGKYLADYDVACHIASLTAFEALPIQAPVDVRPSSNDESHLLLGQGTRVRTVRLTTPSTTTHQDGILVEVGASIGFRDFHLILDLIRNDPDFLPIGPPFNVGPKIQAVKDHPLRNGLGVYRGVDDGGQQHRQPRNPWALNTANLPTWVTHWLPSWAMSSYIKACLVWRYGWELRRIATLTSHVLERFAQVPTLLANVNDPTTYFESPIDVWKTVQLDQFVATSFDAVLDALGIPVELPVWRQWLGHGSVREELLTAVNLVNYNQPNNAVNGIVGLGSYAASTGGLFSIVGGNVKLIAAAYAQANTAREHHCRNSHERSDRGRGRIHEVAKRVTTVVASTMSADSVTFELFSNVESLGTYDLVVLAAPFPHAKIDFFVQSVMDPSVLHPMPLGQHSIIDPEQPPPLHRGGDAHEGHNPFPPPGLDPATRRPYTPVVTTVVRNANLTLLPPEQLPRSILMTVQGKRSLYNITAITQLHAREGVYKVFSDAPLPSEALTHLFGPHHHVEFFKAWTGPHGGATPDYRGTTTHERFLLYDGAQRPSDGGARNRHSPLGGGALYYPNAMEQSGLACMELAAIGAKAVAKLIARRLGLIQPQSSESSEVREEL